MEQSTKVTVETTVNAPVEQVWKAWNEPQDITQWNAASPDWHSPSAVIDLRKGGVFTIRMEAKDGSMGFDFGGVYDEVVPNEIISYTMGDGRQVEVRFRSEENITHITEVFDAENQHPVEFQQAGWQAILDSFKRYVESK